MGTLRYMPPEQARGLGVDARSDVYALGVMLYEMLAGRLPFVADSTMGVLTRHITESPELPSRISNVDPATERLILRCMEKSPDNRFASVTELATALLPYAEVPITSSGAWPTVIQSQSASLVPELSLLPAPSAGGTTTGLAAFSAKPNPASSRLLSPPPPAMPI